MNDSRLVKVSKYLAKHLRHTPERLGITLASGGWVAVEELLAACAAHQFSIARSELEDVVAKNDKQRFSFDATGKFIRANQGHSVAIDLQLEPQTPPAILYHGTSRTSVESIQKRGLLKMSRHHVHLSQDVQTARKVGMRHGYPVVLVVDTASMHENGSTFYRTDNGVWLVDSVAPEYIQHF
jgi:putative RNA 2'-phosphotransferase